MTKILLLGGHGKVSLLMTPKLLARSWNVVSVIRNNDQIPAILETGSIGPGKVEPLVTSIEDVKSVEDAGKVIDKAGDVDWVVWSAGTYP
jgi:NADP-dependent 3-hydroxy acid dehydrogenase YdfG